LEGGSHISKVEEVYDHQMWKELEKDDAVARDVIPLSFFFPLKTELPLAI